MEIGHVTHDYIGIRPCGCVVSICYDLGDAWTASEVRDMIRDGMRVERVPVDEAVGRFMEKRECLAHPSMPQMAKQESLF